MVITSVEDFEELSEHQKDKLRGIWIYADEWVVSDTVDNFLDRDLPEVSLRSLDEWSVDYHKADIKATVWVDMPIAFDRYYHYLKSEPSLMLPVIRRHYWLLMGLMEGRSFCYDGSARELDGYDGGDVKEELSECLQEILTAVEDEATAAAEAWIGNAESALREEYEYLNSDEYLIETLIANEVEIEDED